MRQKGKSLTESNPSQVRSRGLQAGIASLILLTIGRFIKRVYLDLEISIQLSWMRLLWEVAAHGCYPIRLKCKR